MEQTPTPLPTTPVTPPMSPTINKFWTIKKIYLISVGLLLILIGIILAIFLPQFISKQAPKMNTPEANLSYYEIRGIIEKVTGNTLLISTARSAEKVTYELTITDETKITSEKPAVAYDLKLPTDSAIPRDSDRDALTVGKNILIRSKQDINSQNGGKFEAESIIILPGLTTFIGKIQKNSNNILTVKASPPSVAEEKDYQVTVDNETEIVTSSINTSSSSAAKKQQLPISSLSPGTTVVINADSDINQNTNLKALKIELRRDL